MSKSARQKARWRFESKHEKLLPWPEFRRRVAKGVGFASALIAGSLGAGMLGYRAFEGMDWVDAFANAAMILSGMGPLGTLQSTGGKIFAGLYALYSGLALIVAIGILFAPIVHRMLHQFHLEDDALDRQ